MKMIKKVINVLLVDDDDQTFTFMKSLLKDCYNNDFHLHWCRTYHDALEAISSNTHHVCLLDYKLGARTGIDLLHEIMANEIDTPVIMLAAQQNRDVDIAAMQGGATDYLLKDTVSTEILERSIRYAIERKESEKIRRKLEKKISHHEKLMSVGCLAIGMAHEINNPLAGVLQSVQNILRRFDPSREKNIEIANRCDVDLHKVRSFMVKQGISDFIERISISGERISAIVANVLHFSGHNKSPFTPVDIQTIIKDAISHSTDKLALSEKFGIKHLKVVMNFDKKLSEVNCIGEEVKAVISIIVENALFAMTEERCSKIFTPESLSDRPLSERSLIQVKHSLPAIENLSLKITTRKECNTAYIEIEDNGPGMSNEIARRVFEPFFTTTRTGKTGLGLAIAYFIITNTHSGTLEVQSSEDNGSKFIVKLPIGL